MSITEDNLSAIRDRASLYFFLRNSLAWPVDPDDTFTYDGPYLEGEVASRAEVSRILPFSAGDPFAIFLVEFKTQFRRGDLREILRKIREQIRTQSKYDGRSLDELVFVCATENYTGIRFAHFEAGGRTNPRLRVFGFDQDQVNATRTLRDINLPALKMPTENVLGEADWHEGRARWMLAWNVEQVTDAFFKRYREVFHAVQDHVHGVPGDNRLFTQRLFNRLLFIQFLSKKGWLKFNGSTDYLNALWTGRDRSANFYTAHLRPLFFAALNSPHVRLIATEDTGLFARVGSVPYLNGGLFQKAEDDDQGERIDDEAFGLIIADLFNRYNFTVHESTPDDIEVAVDPEMLGRVFEELVTGRHESGSYYTPRGIVQFMCREALKGYLGGHADLVDMHDPAAVSVPQARQILASLGTITIVDPACGSGAYLLGMLHELFTLYRLLDTRAEQSTARDDYNRKLAIIRNCLYGVDIDPFAVEIARLRLWLSLIVEYNGDTPEPLPNLDFKVECGDSLAAPAPNHNATPDIFRAELIETFSSKKSQFADPYFVGDKVALKKEVTALRSQISAYAHPNETVEGFDWRVEFAEVFERRLALQSGEMAKGGFDIVLANPPYVRHELIRDQKANLKNVYPEVYNGSADLYCYFYARALQLLRDAGMMVFISPNKWFRADYGAKLRRYVSQICTVESITDFGDLPVFKAATAYPMVFIAQKVKRDKPTKFTEVKTLGQPYPDILAIQTQIGVDLPVGATSGAEWSLSSAAESDRLTIMRKRSVSLAGYVNGRIYYGVKTGFNTAFVIDGLKRAELIANDAKSGEIIKPLLVGRDIRRWTSKSNGRYLIVTKIGVDMQSYPAVMDHLRQYQAPLEARQDQGSHWWELRACAYYSAFEEPKIIYPQILSEPQFAFDDTGSYTNQKCFIITNVDKYLLGVLNSATIWQIIRASSPILRGGYSEPRKDVILSLPIPIATPDQKAEISALVQKCLDSDASDRAEWEAKIDGRVAELYGV